MNTKHILKNEKISFYCTVFNEESSIGPLLDSILIQTKKPDEIIIVDGGSTDKTVDIIRQYMENDSSIRLIIAKGTNVAQGRNTAIKNTKYDIIVSTDAGCVVVRDWLQSLVEKFDDETDIVSGIGLPDPMNTFEKCVAELLYTPIDGFKADWPAHQNIAIRRRVWDKIKYPDNCYRSEDTWFNLKAREFDLKFKLAKDAITYWRPRKNLKEVFKYSYLEIKSNIENDVRAKETIKIGLNDFSLLMWRLLSIFMLLFVFTFMSKLGALLLSPFILKDIINVYRKDNKRTITRIIYKNLITYTIMLACSCGLVSAKIGHNMR